MKIIFWLFMSAIFLLSCSKSPVPKILIIGDSISIGYTPHIQEKFKDKVVITHNPGNAQHIGTGLDKIQGWLKGQEFDLILFNWGLWDICYRSKISPDEGLRDKLNGELTTSPKAYRKGLDSMARILKSTGAKLIFFTTTYVPYGEPGRYAGDEMVYNSIASEVMQKHQIKVLDLHTPSIKIHKNHLREENNVHYTPEGYKALGKIISRVIESQLSLDH